QTYPFYRPEPFLTLTRLPTLRPTVFYVVGGKSNVSHPSILEERMAVTGVEPGGNGGVKRGGVRQVVFPEGGHLLPMENPAECAELAGQWVAEQLARWRAGEGGEFERWRLRDERKKRVLGDDWWHYL